MPWTRRQVRYLESSVSPLTEAQKDKMNTELHSDPSLGHKKKGSPAMAKDGAKHEYSRTEIEHHRDGEGKHTGHTVKHYPVAKPASKSGAFMERGEPSVHVFGPGEGNALMEHLKQHLGIGKAPAAGSQEKEIEAAEHEPPHETDEEEEEESEGA